MAVRVEPPRGRPVLREPSGYPGLTPEEMGLEPPPPVERPEPWPGPPLWVVPSAVPPPARSVGFVAAPPERVAPAPPGTEGLFDVPGLLERLWLARALEAHREHPEVPAAAAYAGPPPVAATSPPVRVPTPGPSVPVEAPADRRYEAPVSVLPTAAPSARAPFRPRSWICPYCYLTNDADAATCRGCRSSSLHL